ncbi:MAG: sigma 54-interacting transcriptional regulator, partial [Steroidobacteraceae bacterium]
ANERRVGRFELAHGGTLFLDEVSELALETQAKLLRVLQEHEFEPVGSSKTVKVDVRMVAASNRDLAADAAAGRFRSDLFYRLNVFPVELPPLRERRGDIRVLAEHFTARMARKLGKPLRRIDADSLARLEAHDWPGNIRDLQNVIEHAAVLATTDTLVIDWDLGPGRPQKAPTPELEPIAVAAGINGADAEVLTLEALERRHIIDVLRRTQGVIEGRNGAARLLNLKPSTARFRMKKLGITKADYSAG